MRTLVASAMNVVQNAVVMIRDCACQKYELIMMTPAETFARY